MDMPSTYETELHQLLTVALDVTAGPLQRAAAAERLRNAMTGVTTICDLAINNPNDPHPVFDDSDETLIGWVEESNTTEKWVALNWDSQFIASGFATKAAAVQAVCDNEKARA